MPSSDSPRQWVATYRLQLHAGFTLADAEAILPYLASLGISHVYLSPCLQASRGSQHGYDVIDPRYISRDLGGEEAWVHFVARARSHRLGILLDIVPNHMAATEQNPWWDDVLSHGPFSDYARYFDIRLRPGRRFCVHICSLGRPYGETLAAGELKIELREGKLRLRHFDNTWPLTPASWGVMANRPGQCHADLERLSLIECPAEPDRQAYRVAAERAAAILHDDSVGISLSGRIDAINRDPERLDQIIQRQFYAVHGWKLAGELVNYRRFFDVSSLVGLSTERSEVFEAAHQRFAKMIEAGEIDGLRIDHPDGLRDPLAYFRRLRELLPRGRIYVEKILETEERLPPSWPIDGSVGYDFLAKANRLWMSDQHIDKLTATYADFTGHSVDLGALIREKKEYIVGYAFAYDHQRLSRIATEVARQSYQTRDLSPRQLRDALAQVTAALGVYRTYRTAAEISETDRNLVAEAVRSSRFVRSDIEGPAFDFMLALLSKEQLSEQEAVLISQWQQLTPAVMAKGVEDTTFYCFDRLLSCNEVGAQASLIGISSDKFHEYCLYLSEHWPRNQLTTSTHDTKRSEDVRTRISLLSEIAERWAEALHQWSRMNEGAWNNRTQDRHAEYLLYQTLVGAWPIDATRCWQYMLKACREAKLRTSWQEPNTGYEENIKGFVERVLQNEEFLHSLAEFVEPLVQPGRINSLAQTLIKLVIPGVPDFYQGTELWDLSLVDPDNRRPVDYHQRMVLLDRCRSLSATEVLADWDSGLPKLWLIDRLLSLRAACPQEFSEESRYQPLVAQGAHLGNLLAFRRGENLIAVVPRLTLSIGGRWEDTRLPLPSGTWQNIFTAETLSVSATAHELFGRFPVALLRKGPA
ncbi:MAG TPA: malto-oligosyltrehalose synthase [Steroidobacteraceae bacterium]|jgi:(1->4)-alpha-D-glucan 1-alpha-D-glucosylmutase|nr:malto-oligosyltrehalose synthase [Steroidobacteraceae bacterium]